MKFSIIIPIYKVEKYLHQCVDSVLAQDFQDYEIILVDDGSPDRCGEICDEYASKFPQIKVIHKENGGQSDARNFGIKQAQGDYLIFLDSDDFWGEKEALKNINQIIKEQNNPDIILFGYTQFFNDTKQISLNPFTHYEIKTGNFQKDLKDLINSNLLITIPWDKVIKREIIIDNNIYFLKGKIHEDIAWCYDIIPYINTYNVYPKSFYYYRRNRQGSTSYDIGEKSIIDIIDIAYERADKNNSDDENLFLFIKAYNFVVLRVHSLSREKFRIYFPKILEMKFLLDYYPERISLKEKIRILMYKYIGVGIVGRLEYNVRKLLNRL